MCSEGPEVDVSMKMYTRNMYLYCSPAPLCLSLELPTRIGPGLWGDRISWKLEGSEASPDTRSPVAREHRQPYGNLHQTHNGL